MSVCLCHTVHMYVIVYDCMCLCMYAYMCVCAAVYLYICLPRYVSVHALMCVAYICMNV